VVRPNAPLRPTRHRAAVVVGCASIECGAVQPSGALGRRRSIAAALVHRVGAAQLSAARARKNPPALATPGRAAQPIPVGLKASLTTIPNEVKVEWPAVTGATSYVLERRSGPNWTYIGTVTPPTVMWTGAQPANTTYAYRVYAVGEMSESEYSNADVVTTRSFTPAVAGTAIGAAPSQSMLEAVNSVRAAAGWGPVSWENILTATDPLPVPGAYVLARHVTACRARMHEALLALGVPTTPWAQQELVGVAIAAEVINEVQRRAQ
jgi:hypothetical protein